MPPLMNRLAELLGSDLAYRLAAEFNGQTIHFPATYVPARSDKDIEREALLATCMSVMEEMAFDTEDLRIVLTLLTALAGTRPAVLLARLRSSAAAGPAQVDAPTLSSVNPE